MCKTLHYTWLLVYLALGVVTKVNATLPPEKLLPKFPLDHSERSESNDARIKEKGFMSQTLPTQHLLDSVESYLEAVKSPYDLRLTPHLFIKELQNRAVSSLIRNGDLDTLETAYRAYQEKLSKFQLFSQMHRIPRQAKRRTECRSCHRSQGKWNSFLKLREQVLASFKNFQLALRNAYQTERLIWSQYQHNPALYQAINSLINLNDQPLPVYVQTRHSLFHEDPGLQHLEGMLVVSLKEGAFTSDTPFIRKYHSKFVGREGALAVFLDSEADGATLSHEFGHLYYLYHHWESYMKFIAQQGDAYQIGGHGAGDCSGKAADLAEAGKMPNSFMPWVFRKRWSRAPQTLISLVNE